MIEYRELKIRVERDPAQGYRTYAAGPSGEASGVLELTVDVALLESVTELGRRVRKAPQDTLAQDLGATLFDALFRDDVRDVYHESLSKADSQGKGLRITLALTEVPELMQLPWEFLYHEGDFLAISESTPVVRYLDLSTARDPIPVEPPLRILAMVSSPSNMPPLDVERERENLERALYELRDMGAVEITWLENATLEELQRTLRRKGPFHVFHFIGHGTFDADAKDGMLVLEDKRGRARYVPGLNLGATLRNHKPLRLAVLNSCEGGREADDDPFAGVASSLVRAQIPAVLAMQFEITDRAAAIFAGWLYESLADGYPVDAALAQARLAIFNDPNPLEWGTPVLLMRVPDGRIFDVSARPKEVADTGHGELGGGLESADGRGPEADGQEQEADKQAVLSPSVVRRFARRLEGRGKRVAVGAGGTLVVAAAALVLAGVVSRGGGSWTHATADHGALDGPGRQEIHAVAAFSSGDARAVGRNGDHAAVWTWDGGAWGRMDLPFRGVMHGVAARGGNVIAVGWRPRAAGAVIWKRLRNDDWREVCGSACGSDRLERADALVFRKSGPVVVVGRRVGQDGTFDAAVWISEDEGETWRRAAESEDALAGPQDQAMNGAVEIHGRLVAVGRDGPDAAVWTSPNGEDWTRVRDPDFERLGRFVEMGAVARAGTRLVAVGWNATKGRSYRVATWISFDDGSTWREGRGTDFGISGQRMLAVLETKQGPSETLAVGYANEAAAGGANEPVAAVWRSSDGESWTRVSSSSFTVGERAEMKGLAVVGGGRVVAVGDSGEELQADGEIWQATK